MSAGKFATGARFFEGIDLPINNHLLIQSQIRKENQVMCVPKHLQTDVYTFGVVPQSMTNEQQEQSLEEKKVARRINRLHSKLEQHAASSSDLERRLNWVLKNADSASFLPPQKNNRLRVATSHHAQRRLQQNHGSNQSSGNSGSNNNSNNHSNNHRRNSSGSTGHRPVAVARKQVVMGWGEPPPKPPSLKEQLRRRKQQEAARLRLPVMNKFNKNKEAVSPKDKRRIAKRARTLALKRLQAKAMATGKGRNLPTTKKDVIKARSHRQKLANLQYGF